MKAFLKKIADWFEYFDLDDLFYCVMRITTMIIMVLLVIFFAWAVLHLPELLSK